MALGVIAEAANGSFAWSKVLRPNGTIGIRERLFGSIGILAGCLLLVGLAGALSFERMTFKAEAIVADQQRLEQLKIVSDRYAVDIVDTAHKMRAGSISWFEARRRVVTAKRDIDREWGAYLATSHEGAERQLVQQARVAKSDADRATRELEVLLRARDGEGMEAFAENRIYPAIDPLTGTIAELINIQVTAAHDELQGVHQLKRIVLGAMLLVFLAC